MAVLVLNASYEPLHVTSVRRAVVLLLKAKAELLEADGDPLRTERETFSRPSVVRLVGYVRIPYLALSRPGRRAVFARDSWQCQYCGSEAGLTIDHVVPRSRGGEHVWTNVTTSCGRCNHRKGDALPHEVGMRLRGAPRAPAPATFVLIEVRRPPESWSQYLLR